MSDKAEKALAKLMEVFQSGSLPAMIERTYIRKKAGSRPAESWSISNQILMEIENTEGARGFDQWKKVKRYVKKGTKSFSILAPITKKISSKEEDGEDRYAVVGMTTAAVFRFEDTEGEALPPVPNYEPPALPPLHEVAVKWGIDIKYVPKTSGIWGWYQAGTERIQLMTQDVKTFFHELAHAAHFKIEPNAVLSSKKYLETIAETAAITLCRMYGFEGWEGHGKDYIDGWNGNNETHKSILSCLNTIEKTVSLILDTQYEIEQKETA